MRALKRIFPVVLIALSVAVALPGCGGGDDKGKPIPAATAQLLDGRLSETERRLEDGSEGACKDILNDTRPEVGRIIDSLPNDVDADVRDALTESFDNLWSLVDDRCSEIADQAKPKPAPETNTNTNTNTTDTTTTDTTPTDTNTTTTTTPTDEVPLPNDGNGDSGGLPGNNGNGVGGGGGVSPGADLGGTG